MSAENTPLECTEEENCLALGSHGQACATEDQQQSSLNSAAVAEVPSTETIYHRQEGGASARDSSQGYSRDSRLNKCQMGEKIVCESVVAVAVSLGKNKGPLQLQPPGMTQASPSLVSTLLGVQRAHRLEVSVAEMAQCLVPLASASSPAGSDSFYITNQVLSQAYPKYLEQIRRRVNQNQDSRVTI